MPVYNRKWNNLVSHLSCVVFLLTSFSVGISNSIAQTVTINEIMSSNQTTITDEDGDYSDWIELYNCALFPVELGGYSISDDPSDPFKWIIPDTTINSQSLLVIFASDKDRRISGNELHTNFKISSSGETVLLTTSEGIRINSVDVVSLEPDHSYSRIPDGLGEFYSTEQPTPSFLNGTNPPLPKAIPPECSLNSGQYASPVEVSFYHPDANASIYYTVDGSIPDTESLLFQNGISIEETTVLRAISYQEGYSPSEVISSTYLIGIETELPVISIITDPNNLWDWNTGIYVEGPNADPDPPHRGANYHQDWLVPARIEMYMDGNEPSIAADCHIGINGGYSRSFPRKSLKVIATSEPFRIQLFKDQPIYEFESFLLRNSGNDWQWSLIHDAFLTQMATGYGILLQDYEPTIVYLNGEYWGIHNLREKISANFISDHYGVDPDNIDMIKQWYIVDNGSGDEFSQLLSELESMDLTNQEDYNHVKNIVDIVDFAKYEAFEIFIANNDWPRNNTRCWRENPDGKFRWILYDTDCSFGWNNESSINKLEMALDSISDTWNSNPRSTRLFCKLMENQEFQIIFFNNMCDLINLFFTHERQVTFMDNLSSRIENEIPAHIAKWGDFVRPWQYSLEDMLEFGEDRASFVFQHINERFGFNDPVAIHLYNDEQQKGKIWINGFPLHENYFTGKYYSEVPVKIWTESKSGYSFAGWSGAIESDSDTLLFYPYEGIEIFAYYEEEENPLPRVVINEINYNSDADFECQDWIEITTPEEFVDISFWSIKDNQNDSRFTLPENTLLYKNSFLILARDRELFLEHYQNCDLVLGDLGFGLNSSGDVIRLYNQNNQLIDSVNFKPSLPWPPQANGMGSTLQLVDIYSDNSLPNNWIASTKKNGNPGSSNQIIDVKPTITEKPIIPEVYGIINTYPNPFNSNVTIEFIVPSTTIIEFSLYNIQGQLVKKISKQFCLRDHLYSLTMNSDNMASGLYFLCGTTENNETYLKKITLIK